MNILEALVKSALAASLCAVLLSHAMATLGELYVEHEKTQSMETCMQKLGMLELGTEDSSNEL